MSGTLLGLYSRWCICLWKPSLEEAHPKGARTLIRSLSFAKCKRPKIVLYERHGFTAVEEDGGTLLIYGGRKADERGVIGSRSIGGIDPPSVLGV